MSLTDLKTDRSFWLFCFYAQLLMLSGFIVNRGWESRYYEKKVVVEGSPYIPDADPKINKPVPGLLVANATGIHTDLSSPSNKPRVVALLSKCAPCSIDYLKVLDGFQMANPNIQVCAVFPERAEHVANFLGPYGFHLQEWAEDSLTISRAYNTAWRPRLYFMDKQGNLLYAQIPDDSMQKALSHINAMTKHLHIEVQTSHGGTRR